MTDSVRFKSKHKLKSVSGTDNAKLTTTASFVLVVLVRGFSDSSRGETALFRRVHLKDVVEKMNLQTQQKNRESCMQDGSVGIGVLGRRTRCRHGGTPKKDATSHYRVGFRAAKIRRTAGNWA